jgi:hypothetical protein
MTSHATTRRTARATATLALLGAGLATGAGAATSPADARTTAAAAPSRTTVTFTVDDCRGCTVTLHQGLVDGDDVVQWHSHPKKVRHGEVSFSVRSKRTAGMQATVEAPWEGHTGYLTNVVFRYAHEQVGDRMTFGEARGRKRASGCWEGTGRDHVTIPIVVREVQVRGVTERVPGSIAFARRTQSWLDPMARARHGVLGSQDVFACQ